LEYLDWYIRNLEKINNLLNKFNTVQLQFVLGDFKTFLDKDKLILLKESIYKEKYFIHYQFIILEKSPDKWDNFNLNNLKNWKEFLNIEPKPIFFKNITDDLTSKYYEIFQLYINNNFKFNSCINNNFRLKYNFDFIYECTKEIFIFNIKKTPAFKIKKIFNKKINCLSDFCDMQMCGYCDKFK
jgi:hypothetical protein